MQLERQVVVSGTGKLVNGNITESQKNILTEHFLSWHTTLFHYSNPQDSHPLFHNSVNQHAVSFSYLHVYYSKIVDCSFACSFTGSDNLVIFFGKVQKLFPTHPSLIHQGRALLEDLDAPALFLQHDPGNSSNEDSSCRLNTVSP